VGRHRLRAGLRLGCALILLGAAAFTLAACGRSAPLEPPPSPAAAPTASALPPGPATPGDSYSPNSQAAQERAQKTGFDSFGNPVAPPGQKKSFVLDPILQ